MKNLENYGVQELNTVEQKNVSGGYAITRGCVTTYYRRDGRGGWTAYKTVNNCG